MLSDADSGDKSIPSVKPENTNLVMNVSSQFECQVGNEFFNAFTQSPIFL